MPKIKQIALDVLKPHLPSALDLASAIANIGPDYQVRIEVLEMDEKTETTMVVIEGDALDYPQIEQVIEAQGGSVHSIDKVEVWGDAGDGG
jgi:hypothetical protein